MGLPMERARKTCWPTFFTMANCPSMLRTFWASPDMTAASASSVVMLKMTLLELSSRLTKSVGVFVLELFIHFSIAAMLLFSGEIAKSDHGDEGAGVLGFKISKGMGVGEAEVFEGCFECGGVFRFDRDEEAAAGLGVGEDKALFGC